MNIEQGMSKEEGRGLSEEIATKNAKNHNESLKLTYLGDRNQSCHAISSRVFLRFFVAITLLPSTFLARHSSVPQA
jgi:hypothetical protein